MSKDVEEIKDAFIEDNLRERLVKVAKELWEDGLVRGSAGNISAKIPGTKTCLIKPSGFRFKELQKDHFIVVNYETREVIKGTRKPSVETPFHTGIYKVRPDVGGVVHTHATTIVGFSAANIPIVPVYMGAMMGVPIAGWHFPGTEDLAEDAIKTLGDGNAVMIKHHGLITVGPSIERASNLTIGLEEAAKAQLVAHLLGCCDTVPYDEIEERRGKRPSVSLPE
jgi:L-fuculose-phosphate aldolase